MDSVEWRTLKQVTIELLNQCTQSCIFCSSMSVPDDNASRLSLDEVKSILGEVVALGAEMVAFSGGEPLLYEELGSCIAFASQLGIETYLYTSGIMYDSNRKLRSLTLRDINWLQESGVYQVYLSIHGASGQSHDVLCGMSGSYNLAIESLRLLSSANIRVGIHYLVTKTNLKELLSAADILLQLGACDFKPLKLIFQGRASDKRTDLELSSQDRAAFLEQMQLLYLKYGNKLTLGCFWEEQLSHVIACPDCKVGQHVLTIKADGNVVPCGAHKFTFVGNIRTSNLSDIWRNSAKLQHLSSHEGPVCAYVKQKRIV